MRVTKCGLTPSLEHTEHPPEIVTEHHHDHEPIHMKEVRGLMAGCADVCWTMMRGVRECRHRKHFFELSVLGPKDSDGSRVLPHAGQGPHTE